MAADLPRYAVYQGRRVRVLHYHRNGRFMVLDRSDERRLVRRDLLTMLPTRKEH